MPTIVDKPNVISLLREEFAALGELCSGLQPHEWEAPTCLPGWTVRDNVSHVVGTESSLLGEKPPNIDVAHLSHMKNAIAQANEVWVESLRTLDGPAVLARLRSVSAQRLAALDAMTQADFDAASWTPAGPDETYGRFMRIRHYDCFMHEHDIRSAISRPDRAQPEHVGSALDEVAAGLGYIVGRKAGFPPGSTVRIELTGAASRGYSVVVDQRASVVENPLENPTVTLIMPTMLFLRLTGGRESATPHLDDDLQVEGDRELGRRLAEHLAFTI